MATHVYTTLQLTKIKILRKSSLKITKEKSKRSSIRKIILGTRHQMLHIQKNQVMLSHYAWQLCGMSEAGLIPQTFSKRHARYGTPIHASMFSILLITILVYFDFTENLVLNNRNMLLSKSRWCRWSPCKSLFWDFSNTS